MRGLRLKLRYPDGNKVMNLNIGGDQQFASPTFEQVELMLRVLGKPFAVLERGKYEFMQVVVYDDGYLLEVQDGSEQEHYQCTNRNLSLKQVTNLFKSYLAGEDTWRESYEWKQISPSSPVRRV